jgi:hypothetical protein
MSALLLREGSRGCSEGVRCCDGIVLPAVCVVPMLCGANPSGACMLLSLANVVVSIASRALAVAFRWRCWLLALSAVWEVVDCEMFVGCCCWLVCRAMV